jgi:poly(3-hydroxybutyrate) depolymerase
MGIAIGPTPITAMRVGSTEISRVYQGANLVYELAAATIPATVRSITAASIAYNTTAKTIAKPAGTATGDLLLLAIHIDYGAMSAFAPPSGFTVLQSIDQGNNLSKCLIAYKVATASEPASYTMSIPVDADCRADMIAVQDAETSVAPAIAMTTGSASNTAHTAPTVTPKSASGLLLCIASKDATTSGVTFAWTPPTGMTERSDATVNTYLSMTTATVGWDSANATGARQFGLAVTPTTTTATEALLTSVVVPTKGSVQATPPPTSSYTPTPSITTTPAGPYTDRTAVSYTGAGRTSEYHINTTAASAGVPAPLVIHLHGDGYQEYTNMKNGVTTSVAYEYQDTARSHGAIFVMPRTPDTTSQTWWSQQYPTDWLVALITKLKADYLIDTKRIFLNGYSGGAEEITYFLMADHSNLFTGGGAQILGGGGAEGLSFALQPTAALKAQFPMHWNVGENDVEGSTDPPEFSGRASAAEGEAFYRAAGFSTQIQIIPGVDHNGSEPYGPEKLNNLMNASNTLYGLPTVGATAPPAGYQAVNSGGSGGSYTDAFSTSSTPRSFTDGAGTTTTYRFWGSHVTAATKTAGVPLVIHLHGDGAYEYDNPTTWTSPQYMQVAKDIGGIGVIPKAMDMAGGYLSWWAGTRGANWVANLIVELQRIYNIDKRQVYLSGFSGGAVIIAEDIMQRHHQKLLGGGAMLLGGGQPGTMVGTPSADLLRDFPMHWHVGTLDIPGNTADGYDGKGAAEQGEAYYRGLGFKTKLTYIQGDDHDASEDNGPAALRALVNTSRAIYGKTSI